MPIMAINHSFASYTDSKTSLIQIAQKTNTGSKITVEESGELKITRDWKLLYGLRVNNVLPRVNSYHSPELEIDGEKVETNLYSTKEN